MMADNSQDLSRSRAVLIGTGTYTHLPPVSAARHSLDRMRSLLTGELCGWPLDRVTVFRDLREPGSLPDQLVELFHAAQDVALFYYVGHGQVDPQDTLCLGLVGSRVAAERRRTTSLPFDAVRYALTRSRARVKIVILDCCYAGLAAQPTLSADDVSDRTRGTGAYTLAAAGEFARAWYETDPAIAKPQTYFTRYFADIIEAGIPGEGPELRLEPIFNEVVEALARDGKPEPISRTADRAARFVFAHNAAFRPPTQEAGDLKGSAPRAQQPLVLRVDGEPSDSAEKQTGPVTIHDETQGTVTSTGPVDGSEQLPVVQPAGTGSSIHASTDQQADPPARPYTEAFTAASEEPAEGQPLRAALASRSGVRPRVEGSAAAAILPPKDSSVTDQGRDVAGEPQTAEQRLRRPQIQRRTVLVAGLTIATAAAVSVPLTTHLTQPTEHETATPHPSANTPTRHTTTPPAAAPSRQRTLKATEIVEAVAFSPDGKTLAAGIRDGTVQLWDASTGRKTATFNSDSGSVNAVAFSPSGKTLATGSSYGLTRLWDVASGHNTVTTTRTEIVEAVAFSPNGKTLATCTTGNLETNRKDASARLWDVATGHNTATLRHSAPVGALAFSPDGKFLATGSWDDARLWDAATGHKIATLSHSGIVEAVAFSPDGKTLATVDGTWDKVRLWDVATGRNTVTRTAPTAVSGSMVAFSPDGNILAIGGYVASELLLWDVVDDRTTGTLTAALSGILNAVVFSRDGKFLAASGTDKIVQLWSIS